MRWISLDFPEPISNKSMRGKWTCVTVLQLQNIQKHSINKNYNIQPQRKEKQNIQKHILAETILEFLRESLLEARI